MLKLLTIPTFLMVALILFAGPVYAQEDLTPPTLLGVSFTPEVIDTSRGPVTVTVTVHVADDLSGVANVFLQFRKPGTTQGAQVEFRPGTNFSELIEGDTLDGRHMATMILPQYSAFGEWEMHYVMVADNVGNRSDLWKPDNAEAGFTDSSDWPSLFNEFAFVVGANQPQQVTYQLFVPAVGG